MSNVFDPIELLKPIEPKPWAVMITEETASGTEVPAARKVKPITVSENREVLDLQLESLQWETLTNIRWDEDDEIWNATDP